MAGNDGENFDNGKNVDDSKKVDDGVGTSTVVNYSKSLPDVSKIEVFEGQNFRRWAERVFSLLDVKGVTSALTAAEPDEAKTDPKLVEGWKHANKVCRYTILSTLSNDLFDVYCSYKGAKEIWDNLNIKYTAEDATKQKFVVGNFLRWQMVEDKEIKAQINEYHKLLEELKAEKIDLPDVFVAGALMEKLPSSWNDYKQQLKHKHTQMSLADLIKHVIIKDTSRKECDAARAKTFESRANLIQNNAHKKKRSENKPDHVLGVTNPGFKAKCFVCGKPGHKAYQCRHRKTNNMPLKPKANLTLGDDKKDDDDDDIIAAIQEPQDTSVQIELPFTSYSSVGDDEDQVYLGDSKTAAVKGKGKVILKLTSGKTLVLSDVLHVPTIRTNLMSVALLNKVGVKVSFESDKIVMTKNNVFVGKGYCDQGLFVLSISD
ncbi:uncharacterized protein LOC123895839 [Trifolium pratense]|uniref:uncharacterized protein LOC123895839 n=1 Tax=Trifolium pratense TaxID=57577 RepID=UPI001E691554|nr:uncharacterized protein LOC123895839 [Trifolium pratense]